jgi:hypothetical protein
MGESNLPLRSLLSKGAKVMLLDNFIVEYKLMNGSVGVVQDLYFSNAEGKPHDKMYVVVDFCEKNCCSISAMPLQVEGKQFEKVVVCLHVSGNKCPGLELVAISRAVELADFAIGNSSTQLTKQDLFNIGKTLAYKTRRDFLT